MAQNLVNLRLDPIPQLDWSDVVDQRTFQDILTLVKFVCKRLILEKAVEKLMVDGTREK